MDMFEKAAKTAKTVGDNVINSAKSIGSTIYHSTKEQSELASLNIQKNTLEKKLDSSYAQIGRRYCDYVGQCETGVVFMVEDILEDMQPDLEKLSKLKEEISLKEEEIKTANQEKQYKKAQDEFETEKKKLDKAMELDIITLEEYNTKLSFAQKKLDNYALIQKIEMQLEMDIISKEEYNEKIRMILQ